jgi:hypothetical protein
MYKVKRDGKRLAWFLEIEDMAEHYRYQQLLEPDAIRLIAAHPSAELESHMHCELISTTLTACHGDMITNTLHYLMFGRRNADIINYGGW